MPVCASSCTSRRLRSGRSSSFKLLYRYKFLWLSGASGVVKTMFARALGSRPWVHTAGANWVGYDSIDNDVIVFDDLPDIEDYMQRHKPMFQSFWVTTVNTFRHVRGHGIWAIVVVQEGTVCIGV